DGIHGREMISTEVDLGGNLLALEFDPHGRLASVLPPAISLPLPVLLGPLVLPLPGRGALLAMAQAAASLRTLALIDPGDYADDLDPWVDWLAPRFVNRLEDLPEGWQPPYIEIEADNLDHILA